MEFARNSNQKKKERNNKVEEFTLSDLKTYYKATRFKTVWLGYKNRHMDQ